MFKVTQPSDMNETFARAFNSRNIDNFMKLYEDNAVLRIDAERTFTGKAEIAVALGNLLKVPGTMVSRNNFCIEHGDIALLRADYVINDGADLVASGSTAEIVRRQADGSWLYVVDHAAGASLPRVA